jgi:hypothetical protein
MTYGRGGVLLRRPDQRTAGTSQPGSGPAPAGQVFIGKFVIVFGAQGGVFIYNGTPRLGNPPQIAIVSSTATTDPYGNPLTSAQILMRGNIITLASGIVRTAAAAPLIQLDGTRNCILVYDASGNLITAVNPNGSNLPDGLGHTIYEGIVQYAANLAQIVQIAQGTLAIGTPAQIAQTAGAVPMTLQLDLLNPSIPGTAIWASGLAGVTDAQALIELFSKTANAGLQAKADVQAVLQHSGSMSTAVQDLNAITGTDGSGYLRTISANSGDTNKWLAGHLGPFNTTDQLINSLTFANICNSLLPVGVGRYRYRARLTCVQGPNAVSNGYRVAFTGTIAQTRNKMPFLNVSNPASPVIAFNASLNTLMASPAYPAATTYVADVEGTITTTSTGNLSLQAACQANAANTFTVLAASDWDLEPI